MVKKEDINKILDILEETYPQAECALDHQNVYQLIVAVALSAQTTDKSVNQVTPALFEKYPTPYELAVADPEEVAQYIKRIGMYKTKSKNIVGLAKSLVENFGGLTLRLPVGARSAGRALLNELSRRIGEDAARALADMYAVYPLYVPNCKPALVRARNAFLLADRRELARQGLSERQIAQCLALRYGLSERSVWEIFKKPLPPAQRQASLLPQPEIDL